MNVQRVKKTCLFLPSAFLRDHEDWQFPSTAGHDFLTLAFLTTALPDSGSSHLFLCPGGDDLATTAINSPRKMPYPLPFL